MISGFRNLALCFSFLGAVSGSLGEPLAADSFSSRLCARLSAGVVGLISPKPKETSLVESIKELRQWASAQGDPNCLYCVLANKVEMEKVLRLLEQLTADPEQLDEWIKSQTSAGTMTGPIVFVRNILFALEQTLLHLDPDDFPGLHKRFEGVQTKLGSANSSRLP
jgi:hypothetical protein